MARSIRRTSGGMVYLWWVFWLLGFGLNETAAHAAAVAPWRVLGDQGAGAVSFSLDGRRVAAPCADGHVRIWDVRSGACEKDVPMSPLQVCLLSDPGKMVINDAGGMRVWDLIAGRAIVELEDSRGVSLRRCSEDGRLIDAGAAVWDAGSGKKIFAPQAEGGHYFYGGGLSPDGTMFAGAIAPDSPAGHVVVFDIASGEDRGFVNVPQKTCFVWFSDDSRLLAIEAGFVTLIHDAASLTEVARVADGSREDMMAFSGDGRWIAVAGGGVTRLWNVPHASRVAELAAAPAAKGGIAFSPDGRLIACGTAKGIALWRIDEVSPPAVVQIGEEEFAKLWQQLMDPGPQVAQPAIWRLAEGRDEVLPGIERRMGEMRKAVEQAASPAHLKQLIEAIDAEAFAQRQAASGELAGLGRLAEEALRQEVRQPRSAQSALKARELLAGLNEPRGFALQVERVAQVVELIGTDRALKTLEGELAGMAKMLGREKGLEQAASRCRVRAAVRAG